VKNEMYREGDGGNRRPIDVADGSEGVTRLMLRTEEAAAAMGVERSYFD